VTLDAPQPAAVRLWRFEVADAAGQAVETLELSTGDSLTATAETRPLPAGQYTVRMVAGHDTALTCAGSAFFAVDSLEQAVANGSAAFHIALCLGAPKDLAVNAPIDTIEPDGHVNEVRGERTAGDAAPQPPATGTGSAVAASQPGHGDTNLLAAVAVALFALPIAIRAVRLPASRR
ncbi:MAG: hypothetical protein ACM3S1_15805, partial [Hyphomicrobiales bacterium]